MNSTRIKKNLEAKVIEMLGDKHPVSKTITNTAIGCLPARVQKNFASKAGKNVLRFTYYSIGVGAVYTLAQYLLGDSIDHLPVFEYLGKGGKLMGIYGAVNEAVRAGYLLLTKQPIGTLVLEIPDRLMHSDFLLSRYLKIMGKM